MMPMEFIPIAAIVIIGLFLFRTEIKELAIALCPALFILLVVVIVVTFSAR